MQVGNLAAQVGDDKLSRLCLLSKCSNLGVQSRELLARWQTRHACAREIACCAASRCAAVLAGYCP